MNTSAGQWEHGVACAETGAYRFRVWAPRADSLEIRIDDGITRLVSMESCEKGYFEVTLEDIRQGANYFYRIDGRDRPDPASRFQPEGVHGPSQVVDYRSDWHDVSWSGLALEQYILYELHVACFTLDGTFDAVIPHLR